MITDHEGTKWSNRDLLAQRHMLSLEIEKIKAEHAKLIKTLGDTINDLNGRIIALNAEVTAANAPYLAKMPCPSPHCNALIVVEVNSEGVKPAEHFYYEDPLDDAKVEITEQQADQYIQAHTAKEEA